MELNKKYFSFFYIIVSLAFLAFTGENISFLSIIFTDTVRWLCLMILLGYLIINRWFGVAFSSVLFLLYFAYVVWCMGSTVWSDVPMLSFTKSILFPLISLTFSSATYVWVMRYKKLSVVGWGALVIWMTLFAAVLGGSYVTAGLHLYRGLAGNANWFGFLCDISLVFILLKLYYYWHQKPLNYFFAFLFLVFLGYLLASVSRSSFLIFLCVTFFFIMSLNLKKQVTYLVVGMLLTLMLITNFSNQLANYFYKNAFSHTSIFTTRQSVWDQSYEGALEGGWVGVGYGVSAGQTNFEAKGLTSQGYGREKGNSQLAAIEETGIIGLGIYTLFFLVFLSGAIHNWLTTKSRDNKVMLGIVIGAMVGLIVQSFFEAWWGGPASPENVYFWSLFGAARGLRKLNSLEKLE